MRISHEYGSKERLFEMMGKVNNINESVLEKKRKEQIINEFVNYVNEFLELKDKKPNVIVSYDANEAADMRSFGKYTPLTGEIKVVATNRNLADILRTLAHEMVHFKQHNENRLEATSNDDGSIVENEANSTAAIIMRKFGRDNPIIFE